MLDEENILSERPENTKWSDLENRRHGRRNDIAKARFALTIFHVELELPDSPLHLLMEQSMA